ncbi:MAG: hypothetical protein ACRDQG_14735 [Pseudonocardiaceae bacterium]
MALVDGNNHQIDRIEKEAKSRGVTVTITIDFIHVMEYLCGAAWSFFPKGDAAAEAWVRDRALAILQGAARDVAAGIRRRASAQQLAASARHGADDCARYLTAKAGYLDYPKALAAGWPIATGIIEGACRHIVADRMVFSSPEPVHFCPVRRLAVLVGYTFSSYRLPRAEVSPAGPSSVSHRASRRTRLLVVGITEDSPDSITEIPHP